MYAFLVALGAVITAAGLALLASGVLIQDHALDAAAVTQAVIAIIGGCILVGLAFVVRALLRVERALMLRPSLESSGAGTPPGEKTSIPFPPNPKKAAAAPTQPVAVAAETRPSPAQQTPAEPQRAPALAQLENAPVAEQSNVSLLAVVPPRSDVANEEIHSAAAGKLNGAGNAKVASRPAVIGRSGRRSQQQGKVSIFDSLWPKAQRSASEVQPPAAVQVAPPLAAPAQPAEEPASALVAQSAAAAEVSTAGAVQIVKSGVVEGMAYTLYSDGSIDAQLPGGTLHFRSITDLRNHIEKNG
jgi:hypothetical protein